MQILVLMLYKTLIKQQCRWAITTMERMGTTDGMKSYTAEQ